MNIKTSIATYVLALSLTLLAGAILLFTKEVKEFRTQLMPNITDLVSEVQLTREEIPGYLDRADGIVGKAKGISEDTGKGLISGIVKGVVFAPFNLIGGLFSSGDDKLTGTDKRMLKSGLRSLFKRDELNYVKKWNNPNSSRSGTLAIIKTDRKNKCRTVKVEIKENGKNEMDKEVVFCRNSENRWKPKD